MSALPPEPRSYRPNEFGSHVESVIELAGRLSTLHDVGKLPPHFFQNLLRADLASIEAAGNMVPLGRARKVSVSLPEGLTAAVQQRVGRGEFSRYVAEAVARQLELDLLAELAALLEAEHGPVPEQYMVEAAAAWPDAE